MSIRDLVVLIDSEREAADFYATSLASAFEAHLTVAAPLVSPFTTLGFAEAPGAALAAALERARDDARKVLDEAALRAQQSGVSVETRILDSGVGAVSEMLGGFLRPFDLSVVEQPNPDVAGDRMALIEAALFASGRPVLVVPYIQKEPHRAETLLVAWDGSATAARALGDALPWLRKAAQVDVVTVDEQGRRTPVPSSEVIRHLSRHGIEARFHTLGNAGDVSSTLLSYAADAGADLMVMGGYGHSRLRELVLGGATRGILESMTLPVLMSH